MRVIVKKWGNSAAVRIPSGIMEAAQIALDDACDMREQDGEIVMTPVRTDKVDLENLLQATTAENLHAEVDFGNVVGKESL
jgi:antitoxin MazE